MTVTYKLVLDDHARRRIRQALTGSTAKATRAEVRIWLGRLVSDTLAELPPAKTRRRTPQSEPAVRSPRIDEDARCAICGRPSSEHAEMSRSCPLSRLVRPGSRFRAQRAQEVAGGHGE